MAIPIPRDPALDLSAVPRHWFANNAVMTAIANGVCMLFPLGERFFVRSVNHYLDRIDDPTLRAQVKAFFKQEGHHARAHDRMNDVVRAHGFDIDPFLTRYERIFRWLEAHNSPKLNLAVTAALEHFTAILADGAFEKGLLESLSPEIQTMLAWHAAEEIEHKAVAFDVMQEIAPAYGVRVAGLAVATVSLAAFWIWSASSLLRDEHITWKQIGVDLEKTRRRYPVLSTVFAHGIRQYLRRDFHPNDNANAHLARDWFAAHGLPFTEAA